MEDGFYWVTIDDDPPEVVQIIGTALLAVGDYSYYMENGAWNNAWGVVDIKFISGLLLPPHD
jgi:hypothetical protein